GWEESSLTMVRPGMRIQQIKSLAYLCLLYSRQTVTNAATSKRPPRKGSFLIISKNRLPNRQKPTISERRDISRHKGGAKLFQKAAGKAGSRKHGSDRAIYG